jgi:hypothetical protein
MKSLFYILTVLSGARCIFVHKNHFALCFLRSLRSLFAEELAPLIIRYSNMARKKAKNRDPLLTHPIRTRVRAVVFQRLQNLVKTSDCQSMAELTRRILSREKITCYHRDTSLDEPLEELIRIRKELNAIGVQHQPDYASLPRH